MSPMDVLFTQGEISSCFGSHPHKGSPIDETISSILDGVLNPAILPPVDVFKLDGRLCAVTGNRRLYVWRGLACRGVRHTMIATKRRRDEPMMQRTKFDYRRSLQAPKWERHLSSQTGGLVVRVPGGSRFSDCQVPPPCRDWAVRVADSR